MITIPIIGYAIVLGSCLSAYIFRKNSSRSAGILLGIALQMLITIPIAILQVTGFVYKSWSIGTKEAIEVFPLSMLFDMAGWSVVTPFEWLVLQRQATVFSNLSEFGILWITKVMLVAIAIAWIRERYQKLWNLPAILLLLLVFIDDFITRDFPWWGT